MLAAALGGALLPPAKARAGLAAFDHEFARWGVFAGECSGGRGRVERGCAPRWGEGQGALGELVPGGGEDVAGGWQVLLT